MNRTIESFWRDSQDDWVAALDCGHGQHVRHQPPFVNRPWVVDTITREAKVGCVLDCLKCDRLEVPECFGVYRSTPAFDHQTVPRGLTNDHRVKAGTWGRIRVLEGQLDYQLAGEVVALVSLSAGESAGIPPDVLHRVRLSPGARFIVEFLRAPPK